MSKHIGIYLVIILNGSLFSSMAWSDIDAERARRIISATKTEADREWLSMQLRDSIYENDDAPLVRGALTGAAAEQLFKRNSADALVYLAQRLSVSNSDEEKVDIIGKLTLWPGSDKLFPVTAVLIAASVSEDQSREFNTRAVIGIRKIMQGVDANLKGKILSRSSVRHFRQVFKGDENGLALVSEIEALMEKR